MRIPRRGTGTALLVAGVGLLLAALVVTVLFFVATSAPSAAGRTRGAGGAPSRNVTAAPGYEGGLIIGLPGTGTGGGAQGSSGVFVPSVVTVAGQAALPSAHVHPGYGTPEDAVVGFYQALLSGTPARACAYATTPCPAFGSRPITGRVTVIQAVSHGSQALVEVTGTICVGISCVPLADRVMMPTGAASFGTSWNRLTSGVYGWAGSPLPCQRDASTGQWHVKLP